MTKHVNWPPGVSPAWEKSFEPSFGLTKNNSAGLEIWLLKVCESVFW